MVDETKNANSMAAGIRRASRFSKAPRCGALDYDRERHLPALIACWPEEIRDMSAEGTARIVAALKKALRAERRRGQAGHWTYDLNRHISLATALRAESGRLAVMNQHRDS